MVIFNHIIGLVYFTLILIWDVNSDYKKWLKGEKVKHTKEGIIRSILLIPSVVLFSLHDFTIFTLIISSLLLACIWWELFDGFYNKKRNFKWRFNGSVNPDDSILDKFLHKLTDKQENFLKLGLIILFTILHIFI